MTWILACRSTRRSFNSQVDSRCQTYYLHALGHVGATGHDGFFFFADFEPDLAIETLTIPAEVAVRNIFHRQKLKTPEKRIIFWDHVFFAQYFDLDELFIWPKDVWQCHIYHNHVGTQAPVRDKFHATR